MNYTKQFMNPIIKNKNCRYFNSSIISKWSGKQESLPYYISNFIIFFCYLGKGVKMKKNLLTKKQKKDLKFYSIISIIVFITFELLKHFNQFNFISFLCGQFYMSAFNVIRAKIYQGNDFNA